MNVLIIGGGGREHALAWALAQSHRVQQLYAWPGNAGTAEVAENVGDPEEGLPSPPDVVEFVRRAGVDLTVVGPEQPLMDGMVDALEEAGFAAFGPRRDAARIEGSKVFAKEFMARHGIPTARFRVFGSAADAVAYVRGQCPPEDSAQDAAPGPAQNPVQNPSRAAASPVLGLPRYPLVVKADGLAAGKGVVVAEGLAYAENALQEIMVHKRFGQAGERVVIEEFLHGEEASLLALTDGHTVLPMLPAQDHKRVGDGDIGPNTGGMGAYAPAPVLDEAGVARAVEGILQPAVAGLAQEGSPFRGCLYAGLMITAEGPKVVEFNARFGDPETQAILPLLDTDLADLLEACVRGDLAGAQLRWRPGAALTVVLAAAGYPGPHETGRPITGLADAAACGALVFHAGTRLVPAGRIADGSGEDEGGPEGYIPVTAGGRVLSVTGIGSTLQAARDLAYEAAERIHFVGKFMRHDIGWRALGGGKA